MGRTDEAEQEIAAIQALEGEDDLAKAVSAGIPGPEVLTIAREVLTGRIAQAKGDSAGAIAAFQRAAVVQEGLAYMEPPYWYYPVRQSLGAALLRAGRFDEAEEAFRAALVRAPNNGWALFGLMETAKARGDAAAAQDAEARLTKTWVGDRSLLVLDRL
jgi:tetratricopeptide (TPR) repeat protein